MTFTVTGVAEPVTDNSSIQFEMLLPYQHLWFFLHDETWNDWKHISRCGTYVQLRDDTEVKDIEPALRSIVKCKHAHYRRSQRTICACACSRLQNCAIEWIWMKSEFMV